MKKIQIPDNPEWNAKATKIAYWIGGLFGIATLLVFCTLPKTCDRARADLNNWRSAMKRELSNGNSDRVLEMTKALADLVREKDRLCNEQEAEDIRRDLDSIK